MQHLNVLNYVPRVPSCLTYLPALRAYVPYVPTCLCFVLAFPFLHALHAFIFFMRFACPHFSRSLNAPIFLRALPALAAFTFFI